MLAIGAGFAVFLIETTVAARAVRVRSELLQHTVDERRLGRLSAGQCPS